jgi:hypothetical protein
MVFNIKYIKKDDLKERERNQRQCGMIQNMMHPVMELCY